MNALCLNRTFLICGLLAGCSQTIPANPCDRDKSLNWTGPIACFDDKDSLESARYGDWLIYTPELRVVMRSGASPLTQSAAAGGGIVDIQGEEGSDLILEMLPISNGEVWRRVEFTATDTSTSILGEVNGGPVETSISITGNEITFSPPIDWSLTPHADSLLFLETLSNKSFSLKINADDIVDSEGRIDIKNLHALRLSPLGERYEGADVNVIADGQWLVFGENQTPIGRLPLKNGRATGQVPLNANDWRVEDPPCPPGEWFSIGETPNPGNCRRIIINGIDQDDLQIPFSVFDGESWNPIPKGGASIPIPTDLETLIAVAGPGYEQRIVASSDLPIRVRFHRTAPDSILMIADPFAHPDPATRQSPDAAAKAAASIGAQLILLRSRGSAMREAPTLSENWGENTTVWIGAQDRLQGEWTAAWPWSASATQNPLMDLDPMKSLLHARGEDRITMVSAEWINQAPPPYLMEAIPDLMWLDTSSDISVFVSALDGGMPTGPLGPKTWLLNLKTSETSNAEKMAALHDQHLCVGNGPFVNMNIDGVGPGELLVSNEDNFTALVEVSTPQYMAPRTLKILGPNGVEAASFDIIDSPTEFEIELPRAKWYLASVEGGSSSMGLDGTPWAITAPIWIQSDD